NAGSGKRADHKKPTYINQKRQFGKHGFKSVLQKYHKKEINYINLSQLEEFADYYLQKGIFERKEGFIVADLTKLGIDKLLGKGEVIQKWKIKVNSASENAIQKITSKGGLVEVES
ncbi:MAG: uL15m family ribosomal protein, partial [Candidatus Woesearchaeota archaeon]